MKFQTDINRYKFRIAISAITTANNYQHDIPGWQPIHLMHGVKS